MVTNCISMGAFHIVNHKKLHRPWLQTINLIQQLHLSQKTMPLNVISDYFVPIDILSVLIDILINALTPKQVNSHSKTNFIQ